MIDKFPYIRTLLRIQIDRLLSRDFAIFDVGAFEGASCIPLARRYKEATIIAIEPHPVNCKMLRENANGVRNIRVCETAITDDGNMDNTSLYCPTRSHSAGLYYEDGTQVVEVPCCTLPQLCARVRRQPDVLILNCEGAEYMIFNLAESREIVRSAAIIDLSLHGKTFRFLSEQYAKMKVEINRFLVESKFECLHGDVLKRPEDQPRGHLRQVWVRE